MTGDTHVGDLRARGGELIVAAFGRAQASGKPEWRVMTTPVLKNRLLDVTDGAFHESDWGAASVAEFVHQFRDIVALDRSTSPPTVRLNADVQPDADAETPSLLPLGRHRTIRPDLWRAVLNFRGHHPYIWDGEAAVPVATEDPEGDSRPVLPTLTADEFAAWRTAFVDSHEGVSPPVRAALEAWQDGGLGTQALPPRFRNLWTAEIKRQVLERLTAWFKEQHLDLPDDLIEEREPPRRHDTGVVDLREFVIRCVQVMTQEELEILALPAGVIARARP